MYKGLREARNARVIYLDMNAFFASVEQQIHPKLRGKPVAAVSHISPRGTVLASSYEAKAYGVSTGTRLKDAWLLCPSLLTTETTPGVYRAIHTHFMNILHDVVGPEAQARSVDEAVMFLPRNWQDSLTAHRLATTIKERFRRELGEYIRCSIGIAPNLLLAKLATDLQKPDGLVEITLENTPEILSTVPLTTLPGIAHRNSAHLRVWGIRTALDLYNTPAEVLRQRFGIWGQYWWWRLHGYEADDHSGPLKSMGHQHALKHWTDRRDDLRDTVYRMADRLIHRLRRNQLQCQTVSLYAGLVQRQGFLREHHFTAATNSYPLLLRTIRRLFEELPANPPGKIRFLAITFNRLLTAESGAQLDLFHEGEREEALSTALEVVRARHGFQAIQRGNVIGLHSSVAREQVGFGRIKDR